MKRVLFVCIENSCRSQMAEGFARRHGAGVVEVASAGSRPSGRVNADAVRVMAERGIDIASQPSKGFADLPFREVDYLVTMGCKDVCPFFPTRGQREWNLADPKGQPLEFFREVRDEIEREVIELIEEIRRLDAQEESSPGKGDALPIPPAVISPDLLS